MEPGPSTVATRADLEFNFASVLVTEANQGLGLGFIRKLIDLTNPPALIFATFSDDSNCEELKVIGESRKTSETAKVILVQMDVTQVDTVRQARDLVDSHVGEMGLTLIINNGGIAEASQFPDSTQESMRSHFSVNTLGPIMVLQLFLPLLKRSVIRAPVDELSVSRAAVLNICDSGASITRTDMTDIQDLSVPSSKMSKAALNMAMRIAGNVVSNEGIIVVMVCPGVLQEGKGGKILNITPEQSVTNILETLKTLNDAHKGQFLDSLGVPIDI